jgi:hypothetical protein
MPNTFGEIYNQLEERSKIYVTYEPDNNAIQEFKEQIK